MTRDEELAHDIATGVEIHTEWVGGRFEGTSIDRSTLFSKIASAITQAREEEREAKIAALEAQLASMREALETISDCNKHENCCCEDEAKDALSSTPSLPAEASAKHREDCGIHYEYKGNVCDCAPDPQKCECGCHAFGKNQHCWCECAPKAQADDEVIELLKDCRAILISYADKPVTVTRINKVLAELEKTK